MGAYKTSELFDYFGGHDAASDYFETLFSESEKHAGALKTYLLNHKISEDFKPQGRAPDTESRKQMIQATISPEQCSVEDLINKTRVWCDKWPCFRCYLVSQTV